MVTASAKGGSRRSFVLPDVRPMTADEARGVLASVLVALLEGAVDPNTARAAAYIVQVERKVAEGEELERRVAGLEEFMHRNKERPPWPD